MARTNTKKKPAGKTKAKKADPLEDLENEIDDVLGDDMDMDDLDGDDEEETKTGEPTAAAKALVGKIVKFSNDEDEVIQGKAVEAGITDEDSGEFEADGVLVEDAADEGSFWETTADACTVVETGKKKAKAPKKKAAAKTKPAKAEKAEKPAAKDAKGKDEPEARERRMLPVAKIKVPKTRPRTVDKEGARYKIMLADMKKRGQDNAITVQSFKKAVLIGGEHRLEIARDLGWEYIECQEATGSEDADDRLYLGLMDNEARKSMTWMELGRTFANLTTGGKYSARKLSRALGLNESQVSRMISAVGKKGLPKKFYEYAEASSDGAGEEKKVEYSMTVFLELPTCEKTVQDRVYDLMKEGKACTSQDLRNLKKEDKKARKAAGEDVGEDSPSNSAGEQGSTYRSLTPQDIGDWLKMKVTKDEVVIQFTMEWPNKTFRNFDPLYELKEALDTVYADAETSIDSIEALQKALGRLKKELA